MAAKELTPEQMRDATALNERLQALRPSRPSTTAAEGVSTESLNRKAGCGRCNAEFEYLHINDAIPAPRYCKACSFLVERKETEDDRQEAERKRDIRESHVLELIENAGANAAEHGRATLENFDASGAENRLALREARAFVEEVRSAGAYDPVRGLYLWGETGTGKTHLAVAVLRELLLQTSLATDAFQYDHASELIARIQDTYSTKTSTFAVLDKRSRAKVWVLDDLGTERPSADVVQHLTLIFSKRAMRPTLITSNMPPEAFEARNPELVRVGSRLGPAYFRVQQVVGRDRRFD